MMTMTTGMAPEATASATVLTTSSIVGDHGVTPLQQARDGEGDEAAARRRDDGRQDDVGGGVAAVLEAQRDGARGDERDVRGVQREKQDHRVGGGLLVRVELLHALHGLEAERRGGVAEAE